MARSNNGVIGTNAKATGTYPTAAQLGWKADGPSQFKPIMSPMNTPMWARGIKTPSHLPSYKKGGTVKKTGLALVHKGEYVIPKGKFDKKKKELAKKSK